MSESKHCTKCDRVLSINHFHNNRSTKDGKRHYCKDCVAEYGRHYRSTAEGIYATIKSRNKFYDNHPFEITKEQFVEWYAIQPEECHYCGLPFELLKEFNKTYNAKGIRFTIDCMDNNTGYVDGNIKLACDKCNTMKNNYVPYDTMCEIGELYMKPIWQSVLKTGGKQS